jgi:hypothetical protein
MMLLWRRAYADTYENPSVAKLPSGVSSTIDHKLQLSRRLELHRHDRSQFSDALLNRNGIQAGRGDSEVGEMTRAEWILQSADEKAGCPQRFSKGKI